MTKNRLCKTCWRKSVADVVPAKTFYEVNGVAERSVPTVDGQIRVLKDASETRVGTPIPSNHNILAWLVEFAGTVTNRYEVGRDGKTPFERLRGKQSRLIGLEFSEKVNFRRTAVGARMAKLDSLWSDGVFLGYRSISGEIVVGTESGVFKTRTVQRKAYEHRWNKENMDMVGGVPWKDSPSEDSEEGIMPAVDIGMECQRLRFPGVLRKTGAQSPEDCTSEPRTSTGTVSRRIARGALQLCEVREESLTQTRVESG